MSLTLGLVVFYVAAVPSTTPVTSLGIYNEKRFLQILVLGVAGFVLLLSRNARRQWLSTFRALPLAARLGLGAVLALGIISSIQAPASSYAFLEVGHFLLLFVLAGLVATVARQSPQRTSVFILGAVVLSALLYAVHFSVSYGVHLALPELETGRQTLSGFGNVRFLNQYQAWTLPLLGAAVLALPDRWRAARVLVFGLLSLWWALLFGAVARGALLAIIATGIFVLYLFQGQALRWGAVQGAALIVGLGLYYALFALDFGGTPSVIEKADDTGSYLLRIGHWRICLEMVCAHPWLGAGPMHFAWPPINFIRVAHPHNALMQWLGEWGLPSTVVMTGLTGWGGWKWIKQEQATSETKENSDPVRIGLIAAVLAGGAYAMISGVLVMPVSQVLLVLIGGWAWGRYQHRNREVSPPSLSAQIALGVLLLLSMTVVARSVRDLNTAEARRSAFEEAVDRGRYSPRYWTQGYLQVRQPDVIERARTEPEDDFPWTER